MYRFAILGVLFLAGTLGGCTGTERSSGEQAPTVEAPTWYQTPPPDSAHIIVTTTATSRQKKRAVGKAVTSARTEVAVTLEDIVNRARRGGGLRSSLEAKLKASPSVETPVDSLLPDSKASPTSQSGCGGGRMCKEFLTKEELQEQMGTEESTGSSSVRTAKTKRTEARKAEDGTWHAFALVALPVEAVAKALRQAAEGEN